MRRKRPTLAEQIRLGVYFFSAGAIDLAIAQFRAAAKRASHSVTAWMNLGAAYLEKNDLTQAEEALQRALKLQPDFAAAYYHLAQLSAKREAGMTGQNNAINARLILRRTPTSDATRGNWRPAGGQVFTQK